MNRTSKKYYRVTILMFLIISLLIPPATVFAYDGPIYAVNKAQAALARKITGVWTDEPIDKVLKDMAKMARVNIFTSPQVTGDITVELMDVPLEEVLSNVLTALGYTFVATDNMIRVVPMSAITLAKEELVSKVYRIIYADTNDVATSLRGFVSNNGSVAVSRATSNIVVTDTEYKIRGVDKFIAELNRRRQQVLVDVKIYEITTHEGFNLGAALYAANMPMSPSGPGNLGHPTSVTQTVTPGYMIGTTERTNEAMYGSEDRRISGASNYNEAMLGSEQRQMSGASNYNETMSGSEQRQMSGASNYDETMSGSEHHQLSGASACNEVTSGSEARQMSGNSTYGEDMVGYEDTRRFGVGAFDQSVDYSESMSGTESTTENETVNYSERLSGTGNITENETVNYGESLSGTENTTGNETASYGERLSGTGSTTGNETASYGESLTGTENTTGNETASYGESLSGSTYIQEAVPEVVTTETFYDKIPLSLNNQNNRPTGGKPFVGGGFDRVQGGTLSFSLLNNVIDLEFALNMLKTQVEYKVLANPRILVLDNETADFGTIRQIPYRELLQVSREDPMTYTAFKDVGVQLEVTPQIAEDGMIKLHIAPEFGILVSQNAVNVLTRKDAFGRDVYQNVLDMPTVDVRRTNTVAMIRNGQTIAIGGMRKRETAKTISKVPLLGDIPLLGGLFRSKTESVSINELVILITPRIVNLTGAVPARLSADGRNGIPKAFRDVRKAQKDNPWVFESHDNDVQIGESNPTSMLKVAGGHIRTGRFQLAKEILESMIVREPANETAHQYLGYCNLKLGDTDEAIENYATAVDLNAADWEARRGLGVAYMVKARSDSDSYLADKAIEQWRISLDIKPDQAKGRALAKMIETYSQ